MDHVKGTKGEKTRSRIIGAAKKLFGAKTYDYVTTRMIANEAHCSQSAISFYFATKENLCAAVIEDILKYHKIYYEPIAKVVDECEAVGEMTSERAFGYLQQYLHAQLEIAFDPRNRCAISFSVNGENLPGGLVEPLNESVLHNVTFPMARLLMAYSDMPMEKALIFSQTLTNVIITYPFTGPSVQQELLQLEGSLPEDEGAVQRILRQTEQYLLEICLHMIRSLSQAKAASI